MRYRIKNILGVKCTKQIRYKFMLLDIFLGLYLEMLPREARRQVPVPCSSVRLLIATCGYFSPVWLRGVGEDERGISGLRPPETLACPGSRALLLNYSAAGSAWPDRAPPPPRGRPGPAPRERGPASAAFLRDPAATLSMRRRQRHRGGEKGGGAWPPG